MLANVTFLRETKVTKTTHQNQAVYYFVNANIAHKVWLKTQTPKFVFKVASFSWTHVDKRRHHGSMSLSIKCCSISLWDTSEDVCVLDKSL